ncbi:MAG: mannose-1-phosphate guanylyltransferase [Candidatus Peribacteria bacterium]|jgi:mannose-1-phosphate guanylyltransferase/mannose-6-phosphate isomerase|nr:mannose-1-phosphate guanylyltransferase [Candidatus Peribacteria bacterium]
MLYKVILAGGGGTRLAPLSTEENPKQFITLVGENSLLQTTFTRLQPLEGQLFISSSVKYQEKILQQLPLNEKKLILEPERKNTAPAIALIVKSLEAQQAQPDDLLLLAPADHIIQPQSTFEKYINLGIEKAKTGNIILFGVQPTTAETGYGYIKVAHLDTIVSIESFKEKPTKEVAEEYLKAGNYLWNSGIFLFTLRTIQKAFQAHCSEIAQQMKGNLEEFLQHFSALPALSIDYAIMEKAENIQIIPMKEIEWWDIGDWERLKRFYETYPEQKPK